MSGQLVGKQGDHIGDVEFDFRSLTTEDKTYKPKDKPEGVVTHYHNIAVRVKLCGKVGDVDRDLDECELDITHAGQTSQCTFLGSRAWFKAAGEECTNKAFLLKHGVFVGRLRRPFLRACLLATLWKLQGNKYLSRSDELFHTNQIMTMGYGVRAFVSHIKSGAAGKLQEYIKKEIDEGLLPGVTMQTKTGPGGTSFGIYKRADRPAVDRPRILSMSGSVAARPMHEATALAPKHGTYGDLLEVQEEKQDYYFHNKDRNTNATPRSSPRRSPRTATTGDTKWPARNHVCSGPSGSGKFHTAARQNGFESVELICSSQKAMHNAKMDILSKTAFAKIPVADRQSLNSSKNVYMELELAVAIRDAPHIQLLHPQSTHADGWMQIVQTSSKDEIPVRLLGDDVHLDDTVWVDSIDAGCAPDEHVKGILCNNKAVMQLVDTGSLKTVLSTTLLVHQDSDLPGRLKKKYGEITHVATYTAGRTPSRKDLKKGLGTAMGVMRDAIAINLGEAAADDEMERFYKTCTSSDMVQGSTTIVCCLPASGCPIGPEVAGGAWRNIDIFSKSVLADQKQEMDDWFKSETSKPGGEMALWNLVDAKLLGNTCSANYSKENERGATIFTPWATTVDSHLKKRNQSRKQKSKSKKSKRKSKKAKREDYSSGSGSDSDSDSSDSD
jgi:hypothetical protein